MLLILIQAFKYLSIIVICSHIRQLVLSGEVIFSVVNFLNLVGLVAWNLIFENYYFTLNYGVKNLLAKFYSPYHLIVESFFIGLTIVLAFIGTSKLGNVYKIMFNVAFLALKASIICNFLVKLDLNLLKWFFVNKILQYIYSFLVMV